MTYRAFVANHMNMYVKLHGTQNSKINLNAFGLHCKAFSLLGFLGYLLLDQSVYSAFSSEDSRSV